jgi:hypothetical protein
MKNYSSIAAFAVFASLVLLLASCSINKIAMRSNNPEFIGAQIPAAIERGEKKLQKKPYKLSDAISTGSLYVMYANAFVQGPASILPADDYDTRIEENERARQLYLRGSEILNDALDIRFPAWDKENELSDDGEIILEDFLPAAKPDDVELLYWAAAADLSAWSINPLDINLGSRLPLLKALALKAYALDPNYNRGALDELFVLVYASLPAEMGGDKILAKKHFDIALEKSHGLSAGLFVSWAQSVAVPAQDYAVFKDCLAKALNIDVNAEKDSRLVNILNQRKAKFLSARAPYLFIDTGDDVFFDEWEE